MVPKNRFEDKFSGDKIATGRFYTAGSFSSRSRKGLAGALRKARSAGKYSYAQNLSKENLKTFQGLLGEELSKISTTSTGPSIKARKRIMAKAERLRKEGKISSPDKKDLRQITESLRSNPQQKEITNTVGEPKQRAVNFFTRKKLSGQNNLAPDTHIKSNIVIDIAREDEIQYDPRSELGKTQVEEDTAQNENKTVETKNPSLGNKVQLPETKNLPDMDIG